MVDLRVEELSASNIVAANTLTLKPGQEQFVAPVSHSISEAYVNPTNAWPRVVIDEQDEVVAFIMGNFDPDASEEYFRCCIWRINVAAEAQGRGVGRFAVQAVADEARSRGFKTLFVVWESGEAGPEDFFLRVGFEITDQTPYGENIGSMTL